MKKTCKQCCQEKPIKEFYAYKAKADGLHNHCKSCMISNEQSRINRLKSDPILWAKQNANYRKRRRLKRDLRTVYMIAS